jgi:hypothetical protein
MKIRRLRCSGRIPARIGARNAVPPDLPAQSALNRCSEIANLVRIELFALEIPSYLRINGGSLAAEL